MSKIIELPEVSVSTIGNIVASLFRALETGNSHPATSPFTVRRVGDDFTIEAHIAIKDEDGNFILRHDELGVVPVTYVIRADQPVDDLDEDGSFIRDGYVVHAVVPMTYVISADQPVDDEGDDCLQRGCSCGASDDEDEDEADVADLYDVALGAFIDRIENSVSYGVPAIIANDISDVIEIAEDLRDPERVGTDRAALVERDILRMGVAICETPVNHIVVSRNANSYDELRLRGMTLGEVLIDSDAVIPKKFMTQLLSRGARITLI